MNFFCTGLARKLLVLWAIQSLWQLSTLPLKPESSRGQYLNEHDRVAMKFYLWTLTFEFHIILMCQAIFLFIFFHTCKNVKPILSSFGCISGSWRDLVGWSEFANSCPSLQGFCKGESWSGALMHHRRWKALWSQPGAGLLRSRLDEAVQCPALADPRLAPGPILNGRPPTRLPVRTHPGPPRTARSRPRASFSSAARDSYPAPGASANYICPRGDGSASSEGFALPAHCPRHTSTPLPDSSQGLAAAAPLPSARN